jgi:FRG domain
VEGRRWGIDLRARAHTRTPVNPSIQPRKLTSVEDTLSWVDESADESVDKSGAFLGEATIYRGQPKDWPLLPSLLRLKETAIHYRDFKGLEVAVFKIFKSYSHPYLDNNKPASESEWMALAQHHGCPTRLMDWTRNPLVALFFATERDDRYEADEAVVWCYRNFDWYDEESSYKKYHRSAIRYLSLQTRTKAYSPKHISPRIAAQAGCFTLHSADQHVRWEIPKKGLAKPCPLRVSHMEEEFAIYNEEHRDSILASLPPEDDLNGRPSFFDTLSVPQKLKLLPKTGSLRKAVIPLGRKQSIRRQLYKLNINRASLFPGLDGISDYIKQALNRSIGKD